MCLRILGDDFFCCFIKSIAVVNIGKGIRVCQYLKSVFIFFGHQPYPGKNCQKQDYGKKKTGDYSYKCIISPSALGGYFKSPVLCAYFKIIRDRLG